MNHLVVFAKEPVAGRVKTRLARTLGEGPATLLYAAFLEDLAAGLGDVRAARSVATHEAVPGPVLERVFAGWTFVPQGEGDLGVRLARVSAHAFSAGASRVVIVGSDAPALSAADVVGAFTRLLEVQVLFAPSPDGGYSLVGLASPDLAKAFESPIRWSTPHALEDSVSAFSACGARAELLPGIADVDEEEDLGRLLAFLESHPGRAPRTLEALKVRAA